MMDWTVGAGAIGLVVCVLLGYALLTGAARAAAREAVRMAVRVSVPLWAAAVATVLVAGLTGWAALAIATPDRATVQDAPSLPDIEYAAPDTTVVVSRKWKVDTTCAVLPEDLSLEEEPDTTVLDTSPRVTMPDLGQMGPPPWLAVPVEEGKPSLSLGPTTRLRGYDPRTGALREYRYDRRSTLEIEPSLMLTFPDSHLRAGADVQWRFLMGGISARPLAADRGWRGRIGVTHSFNL